MRRQTVPFLEVGVVLRVVLVAGLLQGVVEVVAVFLVDVHRRQVRASTEPPLLGAWRAGVGGGVVGVGAVGGQGSSFILSGDADGEARPPASGATHRLPLRSQSIGS